MSKLTFANTFSLPCSTFPSHRLPICRSMAARYIPCYSFDHMVSKDQMSNTVNARISMLHRNHSVRTSTRAARIAQIRSCTAVKVFEDRSTGIVCYRDGKGELICEGFDEGPRIFPEAQNPGSHRRGLLFNDLLQTIIDVNNPSITDRVDKQKDKQGFYWKFLLDFDKE